ncbi:MAG: carboxymuconolactone decarboxylase family protein [Acidimicrobiales bacterium]
MSRAKPVTYQEANAEQREVWDEIIASRGDAATFVGEDGSLIGPFNSMVSSPKIGRKIGALGEGIRFGSSVDNRLLELAIITVGAHWRSNFEWYAHSRMAAEAGVEVAVIEALAAGEEPNCSKADEAIVHRFAADLVGTGRVATDRFEAARDLLGEQGVIDLISTIGYYSLISLTLNALAIPLPQGQPGNWAD